VALDLLSDLISGPTEMVPLILPTSKTARSAEDGSKIPRTRDLLASVPPTDT
jgi:hypothetical protein